MSDHHNNETDEELSEARERVADDTLDFEESQAEAGATDGYDENSIVTLSPKEHVRLRPGMYISSLGDGSSSEDGIYVLLKEVIDNSVDEFNQGFGKVIDVTVTETSVTVRRPRAAYRLAVWSTRRRNSTPAPISAHEAI